MPHAAVAPSGGRRLRWQLRRGRLSPWAAWRLPLLATAAALAAASAGAVVGESPALIPLSLPDPLRLASLPLAPAETQPFPEDDWQVTVETAYFNVWSKSWHTAAIHGEFGLVGRPLATWELRELERRHPHDAIYHFDLEGWAGELTVSRGLGHGLTFTATLPWLEVGRPHWDAVPWAFHQAINWKTADREVFARAGTVVYAWHPREGRAMEGLNELDGSSLGDLRIALSGPLGTLWGGEHRWAVAADAPTGSRGSLSGSGGVDMGVRWSGRWAGPRAVSQVAAGWTRLDPSGTLLGAPRSHTWHVLVAASRRAGTRTSLQFAARLDASPVAGCTAGDPTGPALTFSAAWRRELASGRWLAVALGENVTSTGVAPDFTLHLKVGLAAHATPRRQKTAPRHGAGALTTATGTQTRSVRPWTPGRCAASGRSPEWWACRSPGPSASAPPPEASR